MEKTQQIVILAAGDFPTHAVPLQALREADFVVCCDSAFSQLNTTYYPLSTTHYIVIGDGDSLSEADKSALGDRWLQVDESSAPPVAARTTRWATSPTSSLSPRSTPAYGSRCSPTTAASRP